MDNGKRTAEWLKPSLPRGRQQNDILFLARLALDEVRPGPFLGALVIALLTGLFAARLSMPLVSTFCTAPLPLFLLYFRYFWRGNAQMRELEKTFRFSFYQLCAARFTVLSCGTAAALVVLCFTASWGNDAAFLTLALCGASSAALLGGALLLFSLRVNMGGLGLVGGSLWMGMCVPMVGLPRIEERLAALPLWAWLAPIALGLVMAAAGVVKMKGDAYVRSAG